MRNKLFSLTLVLLFLLALGILFGAQKEASVIEKRELSTVEDITLADLSDTAEETLKDQFVLRDSLNRMYYRTRIFFSSLFGKSNVNGAQVQVLTDEVSRINNGYLLNSGLQYTKEELQSAASRGYNVNEFAQRYPEVKTYVYFPTRYEELLSADYGFAPECQNSFKAQLSEGIQTASLNIDSLEIYQNYYYKSDSHWNAYGAYQGYTDVIDLIGKDFDLGEVRAVKEEVTYPYDFYGNISAKICRLSEADHLIDLKLEGEKPYDYYVNGEKTDLNSAKEEYAQKGNATIFSDYDLYFGDNAYERIFDFHQEDKPNLLIFADSYINTNMEWIASHFNRTVILDLRARGTEFDLDHILKENGIDAALVLYYYNNMYFNGNEYIPLP